MQSAAGGVIAQIPAIITPERHLALLERLHRTSSGRQGPRHHSYFLLSRGLLWGACGLPLSGVTNYDTGRRDYVCPNSRWRAEHRCHCPHLYAKTSRERSRTSCGPCSATSTTTPMAWLRPRSSRTGSINSRPASVMPKWLLAGWPWKLLGLDLSSRPVDGHRRADERSSTAPPPAGSTRNRARHPRRRSRSPRPRPPGRHFHRRPLVTMAADERRSVCELLDVRVAVQQWAYVLHVTSRLTRRSVPAATSAPT
jgi:hypothetical protein